MTPRLTHHARQRCEEMDVRTKRVKRIVRDPDLDRPSVAQRRIATRDDDPGLAVVYAEGEDGTPVIITVLPHVQEEYDRDDMEKCW